MGYITGLMQSFSQNIGSFVERRPYLVASTALVAIGGVSLAIHNTLRSEALSQLTSGMGWYETISLYKALSNLDANKRESVLRQVVLLRTPDISEYRIRRLIDFVSNLDANKRESVVSHLQGLITRNMCIWEMELLFPVVANLDANERESVTSQVRSLLVLAKPDLNGWDVSDLINVVANLDANERESIVRQVRSLVTPDMNVPNIKRLIDVVSNLDANKREFVSQVWGLVTPSMSENEIKHLIDAVSNLDANKRESVVSQVRRLETQQVSGYAIGNFIYAVSGLDANEMESIVSQELFGLTLLVPEPHAKRVLVECMQQIIPDERQRRVRRAAAELANPLFNFRGEEGVDSILVLLNTPLNRPFPARNDLAVLAAGGINVHDNDRDQRTRNAVELLRTNTGTMSEEEIDLAVALFSSYLYSFPDEKIREKAQFVLAGVAKTEKDFPPLLGDHSFTVAGLKISGEELIARLWRFAEGYSDLRVQDQNREKENVLVSIVRALSQSIESDGHRVCNPGKVQRLIAGVLQGRLEGVNIDHLVLEDVTPVSTTDAIRVFMGDQRNKDLYEALNHDTGAEAQERFLAAARRFCHDNPNVNAKDFMDQIQDVLEE
ncbi:MAG TPA: hypothetical protein VLE95_02095 [Chlamydiales bacterium]|nr:hypothetical protein [Chlamydiales bacterium]